MIGAEISELISLFAKIPGLGPRSAKRAVLWLIKKKDSQMLPLIRALQDVLTNVKTCKECGNLDTAETCSICTDPKRDASVLCVIADISDLWVLERGGLFKGKYHVLGGLLSALDGIGPEDLKISDMLDRIKKDEIKDVTLALPVTTEGQTTAFYIADAIKESCPNVKVFTLAQGVPVGGELDYLDDGTIETAFKNKASL